MPARRGLNSRGGAVPEGTRHVIALKPEHNLKESNMYKFNLTAFAAAFCIAMSAGAGAAVTSKAEYKAAKVEIADKYKSDKVACKGLAGNTRDICMVEAAGNEKVARAELEANYGPSAKNQYNLRIARADASYAVAKEKCDDFAGNAKDVCGKEAKSAYIAAKADARLAEKTTAANATAREKSTDANTTARQKNIDAGRDAVAEKRNAAYAVAKEKCAAFAGDAKANCVREAKQRYGQS